LSGADLSSADLSGADLSKAILNKANLSGADLMGAYLSGADLSKAILSNAALHGANLSGADLSKAILSNANLSGAILSNANLSGADLNGTDLSGLDLSNMNLSKADLSGANLSRTLLIGTNFTEAILTDCIIYGIAAWNVQLENAIQKNLIITPEGEATITIDNLKVAQFIYLMLNNKEIRDVINTLTTKSVLILGRFTPERKAILDALREKLRAYNYLPILFDFEKPSRLDLTETVTTLAHLAKFIIADLTAQSSIPQELQAIIPTLAIPIQPLLLEDERSYALFSDLKKYHWVLPIHSYKNQTDLIASLKEHIIEPAEHKAEELEKLKNTT
jgi:uncharacterized protein YjbI with pentapeptide repeats